MLFAIVLALVAVLARPVCILGRAAIADRDGRDVPPDGELEDASRLHRVRVAELVTPPGEPAEAERVIGEVLARARSSGTPVAIAGARHSMGGQSLAQDGIVVDTTAMAWIEVDAAARTARVGAGTTWSALLDVLDPLGLSVAIMQSNDSFTVGGSISVDCHGWQTGRPPIASSVLSMRVMTTDGALHELSRDREPELFGLVLGGYGLFAVIVEVELELVPNHRLELARFVVPTNEYPEVFAREVADDGRAELAFGRLSIAPGDDYLGEAILTVLRPADDQQALPPMDDAMLAGTRRLLFRASAEGPAAKRMRWQAERELGSLLGARTITRNSLLSEGVEVYQNRSATSTDVLHEYFVPRDRFVEFVARLGAVVTEHDGNLLNVTVRDVQADPDAFLRFADRPMFAFVLLFEQPRNDAGEAAMTAMTWALVDEALALDGRFYLPYRLHATDEQLRRAYPQWDRFVARKRELDPQLVLRNGLWDRYAHRPNR